MVGVPRVVELIATPSRDHCPELHRDNRFLHYVHANRRQAAIYSADSKEELRCKTSTSQKHGYQNFLAIPKKVSQADRVWA